MTSVSDALHKRISVRAFRPDPVPEALVREILDVARFSPSGGNVQAWRVIAVAGEERAKVTKLAQDVLGAGGNEEGADPVYPPKLWDPYRTRRYDLGEQMYVKLGIPREDRPARLAHVARNYEFFGAPVGLFFVIEKAMGRAQWAHMGMLMQSIALAAVERGLATCMQEAWAHARETLARHFNLRDDEMIVSGMALGYADENAAVNTLRSERASVDEIASFRGF
jgi:nitroreductase